MIQKSKKVLSLLLAIVLLLGVLSTTSVAAAHSDRTRTFPIGATMTIELGETLPLPHTFTAPVIWYIDDPSIVSIDPITYEVTGLTVGVTEVAGISVGSTPPLGQITIHVVPAGPSQVQVVVDMTVEVGQILAIPDLSPLLAQDMTSWSNFDSNIASFNETAETVTGLAVGNTAIVGYRLVGSALHTIHINVTVVPASPTQVVIDMTVEVGQTVSMPDTSPLSIQDMMNWGNFDPSIASYDVTAETVTGLTEGITAIVGSRLVGGILHSIQFNITVVPASPTHTVTFNAHGGTAVPPQTVADGGFATLPSPAPTRANHTFNGWFTAQTGGIQFNFATTAITADITLHAQWTFIGDGNGTANRELHLAFMFGRGGNNFQPSANITRAEVAAILVRTELRDFAETTRDLPPGMTSFTEFSDVSPGSWFFYYVAWAYDAGLVQGFGGEFKPNDLITREEFAAMLARTGTVHEAGNIPFADANDISNWARKYVYSAHREGLMVGNNGTFRPQENIIRAETATAVNRNLGRIDSRSALNIAQTPNLHFARNFGDVADTAWYFPSVVAAANDHYLTRSGGTIDWKYIVR